MGENRDLTHCTSSRHSSLLTPGNAVVHQNTGLACFKPTPSSAPRAFSLLSIPTHPGAPPPVPNPISHLWAPWQWLGPRWSHTQL